MHIFFLKKPFIAKKTNVFAKKTNVFAKKTNVLTKSLAYCLDKIACVLYNIYTARSKRPGTLLFRRRLK